MNQYPDPEPTTKLYRLYGRKFAAGQDDIDPRKRVALPFRTSPMSEADAKECQEMLADQNDETVIVPENEPPAWPSEVAWDEAHPDATA